MGVREWQPQVGFLVYLRSVDMRRRTGVGVVEEIRHGLLRGTDPVVGVWLGVRLVTEYRDGLVGSEATVLAAAGGSIWIESYRVEEVRR